MPQPQCLSAASIKVAILFMLSYTITVDLVFIIWWKKKIA